MKVEDKNYIALKINQVNINADDARKFLRAIRIFFHDKELCLLIGSFSYTMAFDETGDQVFPPWTFVDMCYEVVENEAVKSLFDDSIRKIHVSQILYDFAPAYDKIFFQKNRFFERWQVPSWNLKRKWIPLRDLNF